MSPSDPLPPSAARIKRPAITAACRPDEAHCVATLVRELQEDPPDFAAIAEDARRLVTAVRRERRHAGGVDQLMQEFALSTQEGISLMCLAEALLRIPDAATRDLLIRDKISQGDWRAHLGAKGSLFVNAATWGLMITGQLVSMHSETALGGALSRLIARGGEPLIRRGVEFAMVLLGQQFVIGETIEDALQRGEAAVRRGYTHSFDMLGEAALTAADAQRYYAAYETAIRAIGAASAGRGSVAGPGISIKISALHPRYCRAQQGRVMLELYPRLHALTRLARGFGIGVNIDAEESERLELSLDLIEALMTEPDLSGWDGLGVVVQAYQKRAPLVIDHLVALARQHRRRIMIRLVKGAYWDSEIKRAQVEGLPGYPVFTRKVHTDLSYLVCARRLLRAADAVYPQFATHNAHTLATVAWMAARSGVTEYEFQCLYGMGEALYDQRVAPGQVGGRCRIYAPVGSHQHLLPYLVRRLLENGANSSFVNRIVDEAISIDALLQDPLSQVIAEGGQPHPAIALPAGMFGPGRRNSAGADLNSEAVIAEFEQALGRLGQRQWSAQPIVQGRKRKAAKEEGEGGGTAQAGFQPVFNPARQDDLVGHWRAADAAEIEQALAAAAGQAGPWHARPVAQRAALLEACAEVLERERLPLISLCVREAGKTWANAVAEIREAVDFCRYYATEALKLPPGGEPPGVAACISPWNFPLAIFVGEISAALAAGSPVLAKPAEQTPLIASLAVQLMHRAGIPLDALQLLPGPGETVGAALTADPRVASVIFTGSTEVARIINATLARRPAGSRVPRLIAETGGQNAMVVDSSALPEQVVQDVLMSAFDSAGQRCSALRVLYLQEDIADSVLHMLKAALAELVIGDPGKLSTDIGPVIDAPARDQLEAHVARLQAQDCVVERMALPPWCAGGWYVAPTVIELGSLSQLSRECFGPVLHVLRFAADDLDRVVETINATGYGLTFGMHSRIDESVARVTGAIRAGNQYVNRNMVGAVVGVQPFGGEGLSGTGPKAGGPFYVAHLADVAHQGPEAWGLQAVTADKAAAGAGETSAEHASDPANAGSAGSGPVSRFAFNALRQWAFVRHDAPLSHACRDYRDWNPIDWQLALPGPTGEQNTLRLAPRGEVLVVADRLAALCEQLAAVWATGNRPLLSADPQAAALADQLPAALRRHIGGYAPGAAARPDVVLFSGTATQHEVLRRDIAAWPGPLVAIIAPDPASGRYPLHRLLVERVLSINTAAAGGNTSLMTLAV